MAGELFRHQTRALAFMLQREGVPDNGPAGGILADDQVLLQRIVRVGMGVP